MRTRILFFLLFSFFVFPCFSEGLFYCPSVLVYSGTSITQTSRSIGSNSFDSVQLAIANVPHAVRIDNRTGSPYIFGNNPTTSTGPSIVAYIFSVDSGLFFSSYQYSILNTLDSICYQLWLSGFQSSGISHQATSGNFSYFNFHSLSVISEALVSTNTAWRSSVLDGLSSLSSSVRELVLNSSSGLSSLSSLLDVSSSIDSSVSNLVSSFSVFIDRFNSDPYVSDFTNTINSLVSSGVISSSFASLVLNTYSRIDSPDARSAYASAVKSRVSVLISTVDFLNELASEDSMLQMIGGFFNTDVVDALIGDYDDPPSRGSKSVSTRTSIKSQLKSWREEVKKQLEDWKVDLSNRLEDWKTSDQTGYLNIRNSISNNFETTRKDSNGNDSHEYFTDHLDRSWNDSNHFISNSFDFISKTYYQNISNTITHMFDSSRAIPVEIKEPIDGSAVLVRDPSLERFSFEFMNVMSNFTDLVFSQPIHVQMTNSFDVLDDWLEEWRDWVDKWDLLSDIVTNYYSEYNSSDPVADVARRFSTSGFDIDEYNELPWFSRVEVLLAMIADVSSTNSVESADIEDELGGLVDDFRNLGTNVVSSSSSFVGLFDYIKRTADRFRSVFGVHSAPVTGGGIELLPAGSWIGNEPLVLKLDITVQNVLRLFFRCFWLLSALVVLWLVVSWSWQKVLAVLRWLWSMFDL